MSKKASLLRDLQSLPKSYREIKELTGWPNMRVGHVQCTVRVQV